MEQWIVFGIVLWAAFYLARHLWKSVRSNADSDLCGGCGGCGKPPVKPAGVRPVPQATPLISLSSSPARKKTRVSTN